MNDSRLGQGAMLLCAILWSTSGLFIKLVNWHPMVIAGTRSFVAVMFMLLIRFLLPQRRHEPFKLRSLWLVSTIYSTTLFTFVYANTLTTAANAILIQYSAPIWAALLGWVLANEKPSKANIISLFLIIIGLLLFFSEGLGGGSFIGNSLALLSGICFGATTVFLRIQKEGNPADAMLLSHIITAVVSIPFLFIFKPELSISNMSAVFYMGTIQIGISSLLFAYAIQKIKAVEATLTSAIEPILNPVWVLLILGESPSLSALVGGVVIIMAVLISSRKS